MANNQYQTHLETEVLSADPVKLVTMLYRGAIDSVAAARRHLNSGEIRERSRQITKALEILNELMRSLDRERGGQISRSLADLYAYMLGRLIEANTKQIEQPLSEVHSLLITLLEGWKGLRETPPPSKLQPENHKTISCAY